MRHDFTRQCARSSVGLLLLYSAPGHSAYKSALALYNYFNTQISPIVLTGTYYFRIDLNGKAILLSVDTGAWELPTADRNRATFGLPWKYPSGRPTSISISCAIKPIWRGIVSSGITFSSTNKSIVRRSKRGCSDARSPSPGSRMLRSAGFTRCRECRSSHWLTARVRAL